MLSADRSDDGPAAPDPATAAPLASSVGAPVSAVARRGSTSFSVRHGPGRVDIEWESGISAAGMALIIGAAAGLAAVVLVLGLTSGLCVVIVFPALVAGALVIAVIAGGSGRITITPDGLSRRTGLWRDYARPEVYKGRIEVAVHPFYHIHGGGATPSGDWNVAILQSPRAPIDNFVLDTPRVSTLISALTGVGLPNVTLDLRRWNGQHYTTRCEGCGYDLLGLNQPRCPECGRGIADEHMHALVTMFQQRIGRTTGGEEPSKTRKEHP